MGIRLLVAVVLLVSSASVLAQETLAYKPSCAETLKFGADAFMERFVERNHDGSEAGYDQAANYWADCKRQQNLNRLRSYPKLSTRLQRLSKLEYAFVNAQTYLVYLKNGGGTMYTHGASRFSTSLEEHLERVIALTTSKAGAVTNAGLQARYTKAKRNLEARIKRVMTKPEPYMEFSSPEEKTERLQDWKTTALEYQNAFRDMLPIISSRADATSVTILEFLDSSIFAEEL